jgi:hypothetical protein
MVILGRMFSWRDALVNVKPDTFLRWHRQGFRLLWRRKSRPAGRPRLPKNLRQLIREMAAENPSWGEERIADELQLKLTIRVSPRTVGKYLRKDRPVRPPDPQQRWLTFVRNHAKVMVACDFLVVITAAFRTLYVFVIIEIGSRKILHYNVTAHPTAAWTLQQFREALPGDHPSASSSMIAIASSRRRWTRVSRTWEYEFCGRRCEPPRRTPCANEWAGAFAGSVWTFASLPRTPSATDWSGLGHPLQPGKATFSVRSWSA